MTTYPPIKIYVSDQAKRFNEAIERFDCYTEFRFDRMTDLRSLIFHAEVRFGYHHSITAAFREQLNLETVNTVPINVIGRNERNMMKLEAEWTDDCQGKKDYDASLVKLSTRYWPSGGGFDILDTRTGTFERNKDRPDIKPSAMASIMIQDVQILKKDFEADTENEVKSLVEAWAQEQFEKIERTIRLAL